MKQLNTMQFLSDTLERLTELKEQINQSETYEKARNIANAMQGYLDCLNTFNNTMICEENNNFTADFDDLLCSWHVKTAQALVNKAEQTGQRHEIIYDLLEKRDQYKECESPAVKEKVYNIEEIMADPSDAAPESESRISDNMEKIITATSDTRNTVEKLFKDINEAEITAEEERAEIKMWTDWSITTLNILKGIQNSGIHNIRMTPEFEGITVYEGIYKLAHFLGAKVKESYNPKSELFPFRYEFEYNGKVFLHISGEHITCPEEYRDAIYTSANNAKAAERQQKNEES